jgi:hypothetical protein
MQREKEQHGRSELRPISVRDFSIYRSSAQLSCREQPLLTFQNLKRLQYAGVTKLFLIIRGENADLRQDAGRDDI